jgi:hypothetical protein
MNTQITCPRCQNRLRTANDVESRWITCPRCLQSIPNPAGLDSRRRGDDQATYAIEAGARSCSSCGRTLELEWKRCPYCSEPARVRRRRPIEGIQIDSDVRSDSARTNVGLVVLGVLLISGVILFLTFGGLNLLLDSHQPRPILAFGSILLIIFVGGLIAIAVGSGRTTTRILTGVIGGIVAGAAIACLVIFAICIGILGTCASLFGPHR